MYNQDDLQYLLHFRNTVDYDGIKVKQQIKKILLENKHIVHVLNNKELDEDDPDSYFNVNILPYYIISPTQTSVDNFICYTVGNRQVNGLDPTKKYLTLTFVVLCNESNIIDTDTALARHDLLAALILDQFNHTNYFGSKMKCVSDNESVVDTKYACRTLIFEQYTDNGIVRTRNSIPRITNKEFYAEIPKSED